MIRLAVFVLASLMSSVVVGQPGIVTQAPPTPSPTLSQFFVALITAQAKAAGVDPLPPIAQNYLKTYRVRRRNAIAFRLSEIFFSFSFLFAQTCEVQPPSACFTAPRICDNDTIEGLLNGQYAANSPAPAAV